MTQISSRAQLQVAFVTCFDSGRRRGRRHGPDAARTSTTARTAAAAALSALGPRHRPPPDTKHELACSIRTICVRSLIEFAKRTYQLKQARSYQGEHVIGNDGFVIEVRRRASKPTSRAVGFKYLMDIYRTHPV
ncbi:hypothetical protein EVAR_6621_1 [Eumeta japonica]|uniref:Uncharacterized protein n=1 Tax=Eumeta variegata TaxID=151549 RepID=A0A4C1TMR6_EUMVA|nr:hypothetical protein EVAR_6621_1 [Eumeta japonica]